MVMIMRTLFFSNDPKRLLDIAIGHFRVAVDLVMKAKLSAKLFIRKLVLFAYRMKTTFQLIRTLHLASLSY